MQIIILSKYLNTHKDLTNLLYRFHHYELWGGIKAAHYQEHHFNKVPLGIIRAAACYQWAYKVLQWAYTEHQLLLRVQSSHRASLSSHRASLSSQRASLSSHRASLMLWIRSLMASASADYAIEVMPLDLPPPTRRIRLLWSRSLNTYNRGKF